MSDESPQAHSYTVTSVRTVDTHPGAHTVTNWTQATSVEGAAAKVRKSHPEKFWQLYRIVSVQDEELRPL